MKNNYSVEELIKMVVEVNAYNGALEYLEAYDMDDFNDFLDGIEPINLSLIIFYGYFNPNDDYFMFNEYGNLESYKSWEFEELLRENIEEILETYNEIME